MQVRILLGILVAALLVAGLVVRQQWSEPLKVSGFVEADEIRLGSRVGGRVAHVHIAEGQRVAAGEVLLELEPFDLEQRRSQAVAELAARQAEYDKLLAGFREEERLQAKARLDQLEAQLAALERGPRAQEIQAARARLKLAQSELELAQEQYSRATALVERNAASREQLDQATTRLQVAQQTSMVREEELSLLLEGTREEDLARARAQRDEAYQGWRLMENGPRREDVEQGQAALEAAQAALAVLDTYLGELSLRAPVDGVVEAVELQPGDLVRENAPVISLMDTSRLWIRAYVPENRLAIDVGRRVVVSIDSLPGREFAGHVTFIARQAEFTPGNVQTPEERSKQVFRIKVELDQGLDLLRPGMMGDVWLERTPQGAAPVVVPRALPPATATTDAASAAPALPAAPPAADEPSPLPRAAAATSPAPGATP